MNMECNPINENGQRNVFCPYYGECLDYAIKMAWKCWQCTDCPQRMNQDARPEIECVGSDWNEVYEIAFEAANHH